MIRATMIAALFVLTISPTISLADEGSSNGTLADRNPLGQTTLLRVDTSGGRTSGMIRSGFLDRTVMTEDRSNPADPMFAVKNHCKVSIVFMGTKEGTVTSQVRGVLFTDDFLDQLRAGVIYEMPDLKIKHMGYKDARNSDGRTYTQADVLYIYDVDTNSDAGGFGLNCLGAAMLEAARAEAIQRGETINADAAIEDLKITVLMHPNAPVLGEVKLDLTGVYNGSAVKMGGDYIAQP